MAAIVFSHNSLRSARQALAPGQQIWKRGKYHFGVGTTDQMLDMITAVNQRSYYLDVILEDTPCILHADIDISLDSFPSTEIEKQQAKRLVETLCGECRLWAESKNVIIEDDSIFDDILIVRDNRVKKDETCWLSYHIYWPRVVFVNNHRGDMATLAEQWNSALTDCLFSRVDTTMYTKNHAFRLPYCPKEEGDIGKGFFDIDNWNDKYACAADARDQIKRCFLSREKGEIEVIHCRRPVSDPSSFFDSIDSTQVRVEATVHDLLTCMKPSRYNDREQWRNVGFAVSAACNRSDAGREIFHGFSKQSAKYDPEAANKIYDTANGSYSIASLLAWAKMDSAAAHPAAQAVQVGIPVGDRLDMNVVSEHASPLLKIIEKYKRAKKNGLDDGEIYTLRQLGQQAAEATKELLDLIIPYFNAFLFIVAAQEGEVMIGETLMISVPTHNGRYCEEKRTIQRSFGNLCKCYTPIKELLTMWMQDLGARRFDAIGFDPSHDGHRGKSLFNLWTGFAIPREEAQEVDPVEATERCKPLLDHIYYQMCGGDQAVAKWLICWLSHIYLCPHVKPPSNLLAYGAEGCGKSLLFKKMEEVIGNKYCLQVVNAKNDLYGRFLPEKFNTCLLLYPNEAVWGGDKSQAGILKVICEQTSLVIERKYGARQEISNYMRIYMTSNEELMASIGPNERRWLGLKCSNEFAGLDRVGDQSRRTHFEPIWAVSPLDFASVLVHTPLDVWQMRAPPITQFIRELKHHQDGPVISWLDDVVHSQKLNYIKPVSGSGGKWSAGEGVRDQYAPQPPQGHDISS
jgi:hypothetical protein